MYIKPAKAAYKQVFCLVIPLGFKPKTFRTGNIPINFSEIRLFNLFVYYIFLLYLRNNIMFFSFFSPSGTLSRQPQQPSMRRTLRCYDLSLFSNIAGQTADDISCSPC